MIRHYINFLLLITLLAGGIGQAQDESPLRTLLQSVPQMPVYPDMEAWTISYVNYRAVQTASELQPIADRAAYRVLDAPTRLSWQRALLRISAGPDSLVNLTDTRIADMPEVVGFDYFDMDAALMYGGGPFTGTLIYNQDTTFNQPAISLALLRRDYQPRAVATGSAWGQGGDGQTDIANMQMGDPFGGDVGLASRVAVLGPKVLVNSIFWPVIFTAAEAHEGIQPALGDQPGVNALAGVLPADGALLQTVILSPMAGQALEGALPALPGYQLAAVADLHTDGSQIHRVVVVYDDVETAQRVADLLPGRLRDFDSGWFETLGVRVETRVFEGESYAVAVADVLVPESPDYQPGLIFGFWVTAIEQGSFDPLRTDV